MLLSRISRFVLAVCVLAFAATSVIADPELIVTRKHTESRLKFPPKDKKNWFVPILYAKLPGAAGSLVDVTAETEFVNDGYKRPAYVGGGVYVTNKVPEPGYNLSGTLVSAANGVNITPRTRKLFEGTKLEKDLYEVGTVYVVTAKRAVFVQPSDEAYVVFWVWTRSEGATEADSLQIPGGDYGILNGVSHSRK